MTLSINNTPCSFHLLLLLLSLTPLSLSATWTDTCVNVNFIKYMREVSTLFAAIMSHFFVSLQRPALSFPAIVSFLLLSLVLHAITDQSILPNGRTDQTPPSCPLARLLVRQNGICARFVAWKQDREARRGLRASVRRERKTWTQRKYQLRERERG